MDPVIARARAKSMTAAFPVTMAGRLPRQDIFEACSAFTHVTACLFAGPSITALTVERSARFVTSPIVSIATGWNDSCRVGIAPTEDRRLSTAHIVDRHHNVPAAFQPVNFSLQDSIQRPSPRSTNRASANSAVATSG